MFAVRIAIAAAITVLPFIAISPSGKPVDSILTCLAIQCARLVPKTVEIPKKYHESYSFSPICEGFAFFAVVTKLSQSL